MATCSCKADWETESLLGMVWAQLTLVGSITMEEGEMDTVSQDVPPHHQTCQQKWFSVTRWALWTFSKLSHSVTEEKVGSNG